MEITFYWDIYIVSNYDLTPLHHLKRKEIKKLKQLTKFGIQFHPNLIRSFVSIFIPIFHDRMYHIS